MRHLSEEVFHYVGFSKEWSNRLKLVVDELFMNAVRYGSMEDKSLVHVIFSYTDHDVEFKIEDDGTGSQKMTVEDLKSVIAKNANQKEVTKTSGRGLAMITSLWTDKLNISESSLGGIAITFVKKVEAGAPPPSPPIQPEVLEQIPVQPQVEVAQPKSAPIAPEEAPKGPTITIELHGEIDQSNVDKLTAPVKEQIETLPEGAILNLDFKDVAYINSTVIGYLASWHNSVKAKKGMVILKNINDQIKDVLDLVGLSHILKIQ